MEASWMWNLKTFENMRKSWDTHKPVETLINKTHDCVKFSEAGGITIDEEQKITNE